MVTHGTTRRACPPAGRHRCQHHRCTLPRERSPSLVHSRHAAAGGESSLRNRSTETDDVERSPPRNSSCVWHADASKGLDHTVGQHGGHAHSVDRAVTATLAVQSTEGIPTICRFRRTHQPTGHRHAHTDHAQRPAAPTSRTKTLSGSCLIVTSSREHCVRRPRQTKRPIASVTQFGSV
jgi:hypothetical protein